MHSMPHTFSTEQPQNAAAGARMRVLHVAEPMATGVLQMISQLAKAMADRHEIHILHGCRAETPNDLRSLFPPSVQLWPWSARRNISMAGDMVALRELLHAIKVINPDIVHAHSSKAGALCRLAALRANLKLIYTPHGYSFVRSDLSTAERAAYWVLEWMLGRVPHLTIASSVSEFSHAVHVSRRVMLLNNSVDVDDEDLGSIASEGEPLRAVMVGSMRPQKNFPLFCEIAARPGCRDFQFVWVGGGTSSPPGCVVPPNLKILGFLPRAAAINEIRKAHVFILTSKWETLCVASLEAMALAKPILANPSVGTTEMLINGVNGYVCHSAGDFEERLIELASSPAKLSRMGQMSRLLHERKYRFDTVSSQWESVYTQFDLHYRYPANL
jgi:glycosyltransferase involved in cell wall biosynthesis